jgi:hypothetical protein
VAMLHSVYIVIGRLLFMSQEKQFNSSNNIHLFTYNWTVIIFSRLTITSSPLKASRARAGGALH